jgi:hypothetical protein
VPPMPGPPFREGSTVFFSPGIDGSMQRARLKGWKARSAASNRIALLHRAARCNTRHLIGCDIVILDGAVTTSSRRSDVLHSLNAYPYVVDLNPYAVDLKFRSVVQCVRRSNFKSKSALESLSCWRHAAFKTFVVGVPLPAAFLSHVGAQHQTRRAPRSRARRDRHTDGPACADRTPAKHAHPSGDS